MLYVEKISSVVIFLVILQYLKKMTYVVNSIDTMKNNGKQGFLRIKWKYVKMKIEINFSMFSALNASFATGLSRNNGKEWTKVKKFVRNVWKNLKRFQPITTTILRYDTQVF